MSLRCLSVFVAAACVVRDAAAAPAATSLILPPDVGPGLTLTMDGYGDDGQTYAFGTTMTGGAEATALLDENMFGVTVTVPDSGWGEACAYNPKGPIMSCTQYVGGATLMTELPAYSYAPVVIADGGAPPSSTGSASSAAPSTTDSTPAQTSSTSASASFTTTITLIVSNPAPAPTTSGGAPVPVTSTTSVPVPTTIPTVAPAPGTSAAPTAPTLSTTVGGAGTSRPAGTGTGAGSGTATTPGGTATPPVGTASAPHSVGGAGPLAGTIAGTLGPAQPSPTGAPNSGTRGLRGAGTGGVAALFFAAGVALLL